MQKARHFKVNEQYFTLIIRNWAWKYPEVSYIKMQASELLIVSALLVHPNQQTFNRSQTNQLYSQILRR